MLCPPHPSPPIVSGITWIMRSLSNMCPIYLSDFWVYIYLLEFYPQHDLLIRTYMSCVNQHLRPTPPPQKKPHKTIIYIEVNTFHWPDICIHFQYTRYNMNKSKNLYGDHQIGVPYALPKNQFGTLLVLSSCLSSNYNCPLPPPVSAMITQEKIQDTCKELDYLTPFTNLICFPSGPSGHKLKFRKLLTSS